MRCRMDRADDTPCADRARGHDHDHDHDHDPLDGMIETCTPVIETAVAVEMALNDRTEVVRLQRERVESMNYCTNARMIGMAEGEEAEAGAAKVEMTFDWDRMNHYSQARRIEMLLSSSQLSLRRLRMVQTRTVSVAVSTKVRAVAVTAARADDPSSKSHPSPDPRPSRVMRSVSRSVGAVRHSDTGPPYSTPNRSYGCVSDRSSQTERCLLASPSSCRRAP